MIGTLSKSTIDLRSMCANIEVQLHTNFEFVYFGKFSPSWSSEKSFPFIVYERTHRKESHALF